MAVERAVSITVPELSRLVQAWDEITQRLWKGRKYSKDVLDDPDFRAFADRQHNILPRMVNFIREFKQQFNPSGGSPAELSERNPTRKELVEYARQFDRLRLLTVLEQLNFAAEERGIDPSSLINFRAAVRLNTETELLGDAAWTTVERLRNRVRIESADGPPADWPILAPQDLRKLFCIEQDTLLKRLKSQTIPNRFISTKEYAVDPKCLPTNWEETIGRVKNAALRPS